jgi:hypothetical protein
MAADIPEVVVSQDSRSGLDRGAIRTAIHMFSGSPDLAESAPTSGLEIKEFVHKDKRLTDFYDEILHWC